MSDWSHIVRIEFDSVSNGFSFGGCVKIPEHDEGDAATERQRLAAEDFYNRDFPEITYAQAHHLLCYREYARLCADSILKNCNPQLKIAFSKSLAIFVSHDREISSFATRWSERNFLSGTGSPRVRGTPFFADMENFCSYIIAEIEKRGIDFEVFKRGNLQVTQFRT